MIDQEETRCSLIDREWKDTEATLKSWQNQKEAFDQPEDPAIAENSQKQSSKKPKNTGFASKFLSIFGFNTEKAQSELDQLEQEFETQIQAKNTQIQTISNKLSAINQSQENIQFTFVCDCSYSMSESDFNLMMGSIGKLLDSLRAKKQHQRDTYSVVYFHSDAKVVIHEASVAEAFIVPARESGGTNFNNAFQVTLDHVK